MGLDSTIDLRALVREVLREAVAARGQTSGTQVVSVRDDADLQSLIAQLSAPGVIEAVRAGTLKFKLGQADRPGPAPAPTPSVTLDGVVSERRLQGLTQGTLVRLAATAVLTPMAKDAARRLGVKFERIAE